MELEEEKSTGQNVQLIVTAGSGIQTQLKSRIELPASYQ